ncbi:MAG: CoA-binding protein [Rhodospirillales bacterium 20-60-12]|nr:MAG: CoA-binding protein [Rhodospirillales bacterium 20-60-12]OYV61930.1 MAG: CoA-binding protein [Acidiphilium sp. 21-62-4]HQT67450.1 CoA-binding protein [Acetobacteraceae bacterium]HQU01313.1 CoA-binding protein [Acetobacteraceae bacterium]
MSADGLDEAAIRLILARTKRIALVGASANPARPSNEVMAFLLAHGFDVTPVNPGLAGQSLHGRLVVARLDEAGPLDMVDLFRAPDLVMDPVEQAISLGARTIWMQLGVINEAAAARARAAGLAVVMDRCPAIEIPRLRLFTSPPSSVENQQR